ncbi:centrosomal protein of 135 kDa-like isoform X2 [Adelges cooleyi]|uniref:centrosomal protein of 135 kDa-like isoform X1 n=1 Tax=Adelges cooleyi TaxID=133065 RepID=UPI00217FF98A|nr:centrosomal protein of 135 kDa-like isoform X1 [Adelges cooleyi]XP_050442852.1 centrosomal protein of 135 kDa-like isoform X2 [Adelges cooleyi]
MNEHVENEHYDSIRYQLDTLGYRQYMPPDSADLVGQLVADLLHTTDSLKQYKNIAQNSLEVARNLEAKSTPYVRDNCSLIQECKKLHTKLNELCENEKVLKNKIGDLQCENDEGKIENQKLKQLIIDLENEAVSKNAKLLELGNMFLVPQIELKNKGFRPRIQIDNMQEDCTKSENEMLKIQVEELIKETTRLKKSKSSKFQNIRSKNCDDMYTDIKADNEVLRRQLDEALANHNEAMFHLTRVSEEKKSLQHTLNEYLAKHCHCERDSSIIMENNMCLEDLKKKIHILESEKTEYEKKIKTILDDQKQLIDKINDSKNIENDLMSEIEKLSEEKHLQAQKLIKLEQDLNKSKRKDYETKSEKAVKSQRDSSPHNKRINDLEITISKLRAERDEHLYEINCLKRQHRNQIIDLNKKIEDMQRETQDTSEKKFTLQLRREKDECTEEIICLKKEIQFLSNQLKKTRDSVESNEYNEREYVKRLENEKHQLIEKQRSLTWESANKQREAEKYVRDITHMKTELKRHKAIIDDQKCSQDRLERALQSTQFAQNAIEEQLERAHKRIEELKHLNNTLNDRLMNEKQEKHMYHDSIAVTDHRHETLVTELEKKTKRIAFLDGLVMDKEQEIASLHSKLNDASKKIGNALYSQAESEKMCDRLKSELSNIKMEYKIAESNTGSREKEKKRLQNDLDMVMQDNKGLRSELESSKKQTEDLKMQLQVYVLEIRRIEEMLELKESERDEILDQFKHLNCEATQLESNNHSLESEARSSKTLLREKEHQVSDLERKLLDKEELISSFETQISELTHQVVSLESQLTIGNDRIIKLEQDLVACRNICSTVDSAKMTLNERLCHTEQLQHKAEEERLRLTSELSFVNTQLERERSKIATLETVLTDSRQECMELTIIKNDLTEKLEESQQKSKTLTELLEKTKTELMNARSEVAACEHEISLLKRQLNDVKFEKAKLEQSRRENHSTTL